MKIIMAQFWAHLVPLKSGHVKNSEQTPHDKLANFIDLCAFSALSMTKNLIYDLVI